MPLADKPSCSHEQTTLVQAFFTDDVLDTIWFVCWQCDLCGSISRKEVTSEQLEGAENLPFLDEDSYERATKERLEEQVEWAALQFMNKAVHASPRNGNGHR